LIANNSKGIATVIYFHTQAPFYLAQVLIKLATQIRQPFIIGGF
jgi:hypothetical protein